MLFFEPGLIEIGLRLEKIVNGVVQFEHGLRLGFCAALPIQTEVEIALWIQGLQLRVSLECMNDVRIGPANAHFGEKLVDAAVFLLDHKMQVKNYLNIGMLA